MRDVMRRLESLEARSYGTETGGRDSSDPELCRFLAKLEPAALRRCLPRFTDEQFAELVEDIRQHVSEYGQEHATCYVR